MSEGVMVRIGVISDTHITKVTDDFQRVMDRLFKSVDHLIHAGDIISPEVYEYLCQWNLFAVRGNMDDSRLWDILPRTRIETIEGKRIGIVHGAGSWHHVESFVLTQFHDVDLIVFGHSHMPLYKKEGTTEVFNPGALMRPVSQQKTVGILEIEDEIACRHIPVT
jgi:uncharacterized protein